ncbi:mitochondrial ribonuclease P catalytic subunit isoform X2 [Polypterus senegalus]
MSISGIAFLVYQRASRVVIQKHTSSLLKDCRTPKIASFSSCALGKNFCKSKQTELQHQLRRYVLRSTFEAGDAKKRGQFVKRKETVKAAEQTARERNATESVPSYPLTTSEWRKLKELYQGKRQFEVSMMTKMVAAKSDVNVAKSLLTYVAKENASISYELLLKYLTLCVLGNHHAEVLDVYEIMKSRFKVLDTSAYSLFIKSFSQTENWQECLTFLENIKRVITPSPRNYGHVIAGALRHGCATVAWQLYEEMLAADLTPHLETWKAFFDHKLYLDENKSKLMSILLYMRNNQIYPSELLAKSIKSWFESDPNISWKGSWTTIARSGQCKHCSSSLESIHLTEEEYDVLKKRVMNDVILGSDVFNKTTPQELQHFKDFVKKRHSYDVVIDGLNVANITNRGRQSETLLEVVSHLAELNLRLLVLGRKHMLRPSRSWDRSNMATIQQKADCFFTENISEDDPFLLYATLHSGNHCRFLSKDLMRDHKACLKDSGLRRLFFKWQRGHQLVLANYNPGRSINFQVVPIYDTIVQTNGSSWHIPYDKDEVERCTYEVPTKWLCLVQKN